MKNIIIFALFTLLTATSSFSGETDQKVRAFMRIENTMAGLKLHLSENHESIPAVGLNESVKSQIANLKVGDEVMVEGRILQELQNRGDLQTLKSYLVIDSIHPVSLRKLGETDKDNLPQDNKIYSPVVSYSPSQIPVSAEVATAMTMTTSMLLLENLSSSSATDPDGRRQVRQAVILSTGLMASIVFLYEQIKSGKN